MKCLSYIVIFILILVCAFVSAQTIGWVGPLQPPKWEDTDTRKLSDWKWICWCPVAQATLGIYGHHVSQWDLIKWATSPGFGGQPYDTGLLLYETDPKGCHNMQDIYDHYQTGSEMSSNGSKSTVSWNDLQSDITTKKPINVLWTEKRSEGDTTTYGHDVIVFGYEMMGGKNWVLYHDINDCDYLQYVTDHMGKSDSCCILTYDGFVSGLNPDLEFTHKWRQSLRFKGGTAVSQGGLTLDGPQIIANNSNVTFTAKFSKTGDFGPTWTWNIYFEGVDGGWILAKTNVNQVGGIGSPQSWSTTIQLPNEKLHYNNNNGSAWYDGKVTVTTDNNTSATGYVPITLEMPLQISGPVGISRNEMTWHKMKF